MRQSTARAPRREIARREFIHWLVAVLLTAMVGLPASVTVRAQYTDGLPAGLREITVDGQPVDASNTPQIANRNPEFAGRLVRGGQALEIALATEAGEVIRFAVEVDPESGRFKGNAPQRLDEGQYALYANDALVGNFVISGDGEGTPRARRGGGQLLDLALITPFPIELESVAPDLGLVNARYYAVAEQARQTAEATEDGSREAIDAAAQQLSDAGWRQRYESVLAAPQDDDPTLFQVQVTGNVIEYADASVAEAAFDFASAGGEPIETEEIGDASQLSSISGVASRTGAAYRGLRLVFRQDRVLVDVRYVDLLNREVDQATFEALGIAVRERTAAVLEADFQGLSPKALRLDLSSATEPEIREAYEVVGGSPIRLYGEEAAILEARLEGYAGAENVYGGQETGMVAAARRRGAEGTPEPASARRGTPLAYAVTLYGFADEAAAEEWLAGLDERLQGEQLPGYLSFAAVPDARTLGDASATYELNRQIGEETGGGYRVYIRVGAEIAAVELAAVGGVPVESVTELVNAQADCFRRGACQGTASVPAIAEPAETG